jgi:hypothetical protein
MPFALTRSDREVVEIAGRGGMLKVAQPAAEDLSLSEYLTLPSAILDITNWRLRHNFRLVDVTHSGSYGAQKMSMVGRHWEAQLALCFNSRIRGASDPWSGFLEPLLVGHQAAGFNVSTIFFLGDPLSYVTNAHVQRDSAKLFAPLGLCQNIETVNDATGTDVVRLTASLQGNGLLQAWTGLGELLTNRVF